MDTSQFRAAGAGPPGPRTSSADGPARRCTARPASSHDVGNATYSTEPAPWQRIAGRRVPRCPSHSSRGGLPQRWTQQSRTPPPLSARTARRTRLNGGEAARSFRASARLVIAARRSLPVDERLGSSLWAARSLKNIFASRLWPSGLSRVAPRQSSTPAIELARWRAKSLGQF